MREVLFIAASIGLSGCGATVYPPKSPANPVTVYLADHGIHSSIFLPSAAAADPVEPVVLNNSATAGENGAPAPVAQPLTQFAFSQYKWAALDYDEWYRGPFALMVPDDGALGVREWEPCATCEDVVAAFADSGIEPPIQELYPIVVSREASDQLRERLYKRWKAAEHTQTFNDKRGIAFVRDEAKYSLFHNCNSEVSMWLRELGCEVRGKAVSADFTVKNPK